MAFFFPYIKRRVYPKTFLKDVHFICRFNKAEMSEEVKSSVQKFFFNSFKLEDIAVDGLNDMISLYSKDELIRYDFSLNSVELAIKQPLYKSYENTYSLRRLMLSFLSVLGIKELHKVIMYKYNQLEYQTTDNDPIKTVMDGVFSNELLSDVSESDWEGQKLLARWERIKKETDGDSQSMFTIEYGFRRKNSEQKRDALTLKTQIESQDSIIATDSLENLMQEYNQYLDNAFHWCVKPDIIEAMKKEEV